MVLRASSSRKFDGLSFVEMSTALAVDQEAEHLLSLIMSDAVRVLDAERSTLFLLNRKKNELWSKIAHRLEIEEIRMPADTGLAGHVAATGLTVNVADAHTDPRFNSEVDQATGFRTTALLAMPLRDPRGAIVGVIEVLNKRDGAFTTQDEGRLGEFCNQAAILVNSLPGAATGHPGG